jgi:hypothetical protein
MNKGGAFLSSGGGKETAWHHIFMGVFQGDFLFFSLFQPSANSIAKELFFLRLL